MDWLRSIRRKKSPAAAERTVTPYPAQTADSMASTTDDGPVLPDFDSLPKVEGMPQGCAWGVFDKDGKKDIYGTLNNITPNRMKAAAAEVQEGFSVSLNWSIAGIKTPMMGRKLLTHKVVDLMDHPMNPLLGFDDEIEFNTQCSSQWDSLCHCAHQPTKSFYNGFKPLAKDLEQPFGAEDTEMKLPTLTHWHARGGIVGRGVLIDYKTYAESKGIKYSCFEHHSISIKTIEEIAEIQGVTFKKGDILIVRIGQTEALEGKTAAEQEAILIGAKPGACGVEPSPESAKWFWNHNFAAVAGDASAFESINFADLPNQLVLHGYFLGMFGMPIGEWWDLKALGEACAARKKWSFLLTSVPLNYPGCVASPPNALAIF